MRAGEEIEGQWAHRTPTPHMFLEALLDIRDLLQNTQTGIEPNASPKGDEEPEQAHEKDELFDRAVEEANKRKGLGLIRAEHLRETFGISYGRASALTDQLEAAGGISPKDANGRRKVA